METTLKSYEKKMFLHRFETHSKIKTINSLMLKGYPAQLVHHAAGTLHLCFEVFLGEELPTEDTTDANIDGTEQIEEPYIDADYKKQITKIEVPV